MYATITNSAKDLTVLEKKRKYLRVKPTLLFVEWVSYSVESLFQLTCSLHWP